MIKKYFFIIVIMMVLWSLLAEENKRPKIGLVLSGGGARGLAHIGVLKVLEELDIEPDYITGTSIGSIIGGLYAIGYTADELEQVVKSQKWDELLMDKISRSNISYEEKELFDKQILELPVTKKKISIPKGLVAGQNVSNLLSRLAISVSHIDNFDEFRIPFRCIATNIENGDAVVLKSGYLPNAIRASMSIPSMFTPVMIDGKLLIDGGIARNLPAQDAKEMGADIIIAVDVGTKLYKKDELNSLVKIMEQSVNFRGIERAFQQRDLCDIIIEPELSEYGIIDFFDADSLITRGKRAGKAKYDELKKISHLLKQFPKEKKPHPYLNVKSLFIKKIKYEGLKTVSKNLVIGKVGLEEYTHYKIDDLESAVKRLFGSGYFERVVYKLEPLAGGVNIIFEVTEKQSDHIGIAFHYDNTMKTCIHAYGIIRNRFMEGTRFLIKTRISENPFIEGSYFIHTGWKPGFALKALINYEEFKIPVREAENIKALFSYRNVISQLTLQTIFNQSATIGFSGRYNNAWLVPKVGLYEDNINIENFSLRGFYKRDSFDDTYFPRSGKQASFIYDDFFKVNAKTGKNKLSFEKHQRFLGNLKVYQSFSKKLTFWTDSFLGFTDNSLEEIPYTNLIFLGGNLSFHENAFTFHGLDYMEQNGRIGYRFQSGFRYNFFFNSYLKLFGDIGKIANNYDNFYDTEDLIKSLSLALAFKTPIGPIEGTISKANLKKKPRLYLKVGLEF